MDKHPKRFFSCTCYISGYYLQDSQGSDIFVGACLDGVFVKHKNGRPPVVFRYVLNPIRTTQSILPMSFDVLPQLLWWHLWEMLFLFICSAFHSFKCIWGQYKFCLCNCYNLSPVKFIMYLQLLNFLSKKYTWKGSITLFLLPSIGDACVHQWTEFVLLNENLVATHLETYWLLVLLWPGIPCFWWFSSDQIEF